MSSNIVLGTALRNNILAINRAQETADRTSLRLATNKKVNSAIDQPKSFFTARALEQRASDLNRRVDGIGQSLATINEALIGTEALQKLINQAEAVALLSQEKLAAGQADPSVEEVAIIIGGTPLSTQIINANPDAYWRLNDTVGGAVNLGSGGAALNGTYQNGVTLGTPPIYNNGGDVTASFDGTNQFVSIPDNALINLASHTQRTIELVFNADTTAGRQVLYEEGATVNSLTIYIDSGQLYVTGRDAGSWGPVNVPAPINAGETYHVALSFDQPNGEFKGYLNGVELFNTPVIPTFPPHSGNIAIGATDDGAWYHDGPNGASGFYFDGKISDVALYNSVLSGAELLSHSNSLTTGTGSRFVNIDFEEIMNQIDLLVADASYRGINLLADDDLKTIFNEDHSSFLLTEGEDFSSKSLGIKRHNFNNASDIEDIITSVRRALKEVREFSNRLVNDLTIIQVRENFTEGTINTLESGASDLTLADLNEEGSNLLAAQTRLSLAQTSLKLGADFNSSILSILDTSA